MIIDIFIGEICIQNLDYLLVDAVFGERSVIRVQAYPEETNVIAGVMEKVWEGERDDDDQILKETSSFFNDLESKKKAVMV